MKCFDDEEIEAVKLAIKCELRKNKKVSNEIFDNILEKIQAFKCPDKEFTVNEIKDLPLAERVKFARMMR